MTIDDDDLAPQSMHMIKQIFIIIWWRVDHIDDACNKQRTHLKKLLKHFLVLSDHQPINPIIAGQGPVDQECRESLILDQDVGVENLRTYISTKHKELVGFGCDFLANICEIIIAAMLLYFIRLTASLCSAAIPLSVLGLEFIRRAWKN